MKPAPATTPLVERKYLIPFVLITSLFALWGFANDITNPMVAALFIRRYSYKSAILLGLGLYAVGAFLFIPAVNLSYSLPLICFIIISLYGWRMYRIQKSK